MVDRGETSNRVVHRGGRTGGLRLRSTIVASGLAGRRRAARVRTRVPREFVCHDPESARKDGEKEEARLLPYCSGVKALTYCRPQLGRRAQCPALMD